MSDRATSRRGSRQHPLRALTTAALAVSVLATALGAAAPVDAATVLPPPERIAGPDRYQTAARVSEQAYPDGADTAYLVTGEGFVDGLMAGPAAAQEGGPLLLTPRSALAPATAAELDRLDPSTVVIVGNVASVSTAVVDAVRALDPAIDVVRVAGGNRFDTNYFLWQRVYPDASAAFLTNGHRFPDGLAAGPAAVLVDGPMLLTFPDGDGIHPLLRDILTHLHPAWVGVLGGVDAVPEEGLGSLPGDPPDVVRFAGADRFETAVLVNGLFWDDGRDVDTVYIASGEVFADALAGTAAAAAESAPMLLARRDCMPGSTLDALLELRPDRVVLLGGEPTLGAATAAYARCP